MLILSHLCHAPKVFHALGEKVNSERVILWKMFTIITI